MVNKCLSSQGSRVRGWHPAHAAFRPCLAFALLPVHGDMFLCLYQTKTIRMLSLINLPPVWLNRKLCYPVHALPQIQCYTPIRPSVRPTCRSLVFPERHFIVFSCDMFPCSKMALLIYAMRIRFHKKAQSKCIQTGYDTSLTNLTIASYKAGVTSHSTPIRPLNSSLMGDIEPDATWYPGITKYLTWFMKYRHGYLQTLEIRVNVIGKLQSNEQIFVHIWPCQGPG